MTGTEALAAAGSMAFDVLVKHEREKGASADAQHLRRLVAVVCEEAQAVLRSIDALESGAMRGPDRVAAAELAGAAAGTTKGLAAAALVLHALSPWTRLEEPPAGH